MKSKEIKELIDFISSTGLAEINIETEEIKLHVKRFATSASVQVESMPILPTISQMPAAQLVNDSSASEPSTKAESTQKQSASSKLVEIKSPMIGTFYRSPNPDSESFVNVGDVVSKGDPVCIIEAMKLFNEIESEVSGKIVKVLVDNSSPVEYDQPLFLVDPS